MRKVSAHTEVQPQDFITWLKDGQEHCGIRLSPTMRLYVGIIAGKDFFQPVNSQLFGLIHDFAAAIIPTPRISFCVFVGHHVPHGLHNLDGSEIF